MRVAIVHERLTEVAGSEQVVAQLATQWPDAQVTIPIVDPRVDIAFTDRVVSGSLSDPYRRLGYRSYVPLLPLVPSWLRRRELASADVVIISHHAFGVAAAHAAGTTPSVAYVHSPARWAWDEEMRKGEAASLPARAALDLLSRLAIANERRSAGRVTTVVASSSAVAERIERHWQRTARVVHPPVDTDFYRPDPAEPIEDYFLLAGRLVPYKRPELAIRAAAAAGVRLVVAGEGRAAQRCMALPESDGVTFLGRVPNDEFRRLQRRAKALVMCGEEDFGIVPVEAMACGTPVVALGVGGVLDSVDDGETGHLIQPGDDAEVVDRFAAALASFDRSRFDPNVIRLRAERFSRHVFRQAMADVVTATVAA